MARREARHDPAHAKGTHERWLERRSRRQDQPDYRDEWQAQQCGGCTFWVPLAGTWGLDYGVSTHPASPFDGRAQFEHDGCEQFEAAGAWASPDEPALRFE
jgi:Protein of unknown function (DUF3027)